MKALNLGDLALGTKQSLKLEVAALADGADLSLPVNVLIGAAEGPCLVLVAGVHGDEGEGVLALMELWDELQPSHLTGKVVMVPVANPPAFAAQRRTSPIDDLDLNRIFPGNPNGRPSERIADRLFHAVLKHADFVFSMHSWYTTGVVLPYVEYKHRGATAQASLAAAKAIGFEIIRISEWSPGLLTRVVNDAGIPGIEAEIGGTGISAAANRARYKSHVRALLTHLGMSSIDPLRQPSTTARIVDHVDLIAPAAGVLHVDVALGAAIRPQDRLGRVTDLHGVLRAEILAEDFGFVGALRCAASVTAGDLVFRIFRDVPPPH